MNIPSIVELFLLALVLNWGLVFLLLPFLKTWVIDTPNFRSSHTTATPRGGGLSFVLIGSILTIVSIQGTVRWIPIICLPLALLGLADDFKSQPAFSRYLTQLLTSCLIVYFLKGELSWYGWIIYVISLTAIINFTNFMDGVDGLVAGCGVVLMASSSFWALSGAICGFLIWNWSPARVFMGDTGSTFIGAVYGALIIQQNSIQNQAETLLIGFPLFADALVCIFRRLNKRENIFIPHRKHLFQRLNQSGWSHRRIATLYLSSVLLLVLAKNLGGTYLILAVIFIQTMVAIYLDSKVAVPFASS